MRRALLLALPLAFACGDHDTGDDTDSPVDTSGDDTSADDTGSDGLPDNLSACSEADGAPVEVVSAAVSGDSLDVTVAYSGGCMEHRFALCWPDQSFMESEPVQVRLEVFHDDPGDDCEAYPSEQVSFDLTPLRDAWRSAYGAQSGSIIVHLEQQTDTYSF